MANGIPVIQVGGSIDTDMVVGNKIRTMSTPYLHAIGDGELLGHYSLLIQGTNAAVGAGFESVSEVQGLLPYFTSGEILKISSTSAEDAAGQTGALTIRVFGLNDAGVEITDDVVMLGVSSAVTSKAFYRLFCAKALTSGSNGNNVGVISIKNNADAVTHGKMMANHGNCSDARWTVPTGTKALLTKVTAFAIGTQNADVHLFIRESGGSWISIAEAPILDNSAVIDLGAGLNLAALTDIELRATGSASPAFVGGIIIGKYEDL